MRFFSTLLILIGFSAALYGQNTLITGIAPGAEGKTIRLGVYKDLLTFSEDTIVTAVVDPTGNFSLSADPGETRFIFLEIDFHRAEFYIEPGKSYRLKISPMDYNEGREVNPFIMSQNLQTEIINPGLNELNIWIEDYNSKYDQFLLDNFNRLYLQRNRTLVDTFRLSINYLFIGVDIPYFKQYMTYKTAGLEQVSKALNQAQLAKKYFVDKPILYQNMEYMAFFNSFFAKYMTATSNVLRKMDLMKVINAPQPFRNLMKAAAADTILKNEPLRELVLLKGLMEIFYADNHSQSRIIEVVREAVTGCATEENRLVANDLLLRLNRLRPGTHAPAFTLTDRNNNQVALNNLKGKPVVLCFWTTYCQGCLSEMEMMSSLYKKYNDRAHFVSVSADRDFVMMKFFVDQKPDYKWTFLHIGDQWELLRDYDVRSYPLFVLIDRQGNIYKRYPAPTPTEGMETLLDELLTQ